MKTTFLSVNKQLIIVIFFGCITINTFSQSTMFGVTPNHSGIYNSSFPEDLILVKHWSVKTGGRIFSTASIKDNIIYFGSDDSCMYAVDTAGILKWKFRSNGKIRSTPAIVDSVIYFNNYANKFYALNMYTGNEIWNFTTDGESVHTALGVNATTPSNQMSEDQFDFFQSSPVYTDTLIYFGSGSNMYALNLHNGNLLWTYHTPDVIHSSPSFSDGMLYFGCWDSKIYALNAGTGEKVWDFQAGIDTIQNYMAGIIASPTVVDSFVIIGSKDANIYALHAKTGKILWKTGFNGSWMPSSFSVCNDTIYTGSSGADKFYALNVKNGNICYWLNMPTFAFSTPAYSNGNIFIGCMNGSLFSIDAGKHKYSSRFDTDAHLRNSFNALNADGTLSNSYFGPVSVSSAYDLQVEFCRRLFTTGSIASTPVIFNSKVYFGSTDSSFYAVKDLGGCKPKFDISVSRIDLESERENFQVDTSLFIKNTSACIDTLTILKNSGDTILLNSIGISENTVYLNPDDSVKISLNVDFSALDGASHNAKILIRSNKYFYKYLTISIKQTTAIHTIQNNIQENIFPNPFNDNTNVSYLLNNKSNVQIFILNSIGQRIRTLHSGIQAEGHYLIEWNGLKDNGKIAAPGVYICTILRDNYASSTLMMKAQ